MPIQVIAPLPPKKKSSSQQFGEAFGRAAVGITEHLAGEQKRKKTAKLYSELTGYDLSDLPMEQLETIGQKLLAGQTQENIAEIRAKQAQDLAGKKKEQKDLEVEQKKEGQRKQARAAEKQLELKEGTLEPYLDNLTAGINLHKPAKGKQPALTEKPVPPEIVKKIKKVLADNPEASSETLTTAMQDAEVPPVYYNPHVENRRRTEEAKGKEDTARAAEMRKETLPARTQMAQKAQVAEQSIRNKEQLIDLIEKGNIDDPTWATLAESLPLNLGKRLLSPDTLMYKAGLVEEYGDLKNIFSGATRVKEIDILEGKIADLYLTDAQKKAVLRSRINAEKAHVIRAEAAAKLEDRGDLGVLQFNAEVEKLAKPELDKLFDQILHEQRSIIESAEKRKNLPLDMNDADDVQIINAILQEAGNDYKKAEKIAKQKGYTW